MFSVRFPAMRTCILLTLLWLIPQQASALWIHIQDKRVKVGSWSLLGVSFNHYKHNICVEFGFDDPPPHLQNFAVFLDDLTPPEDLALAQLRYYPGPGALGGDSLIFDDTMFPAPPGYTFDTLGGTEFNIHFDTPRPLFGEPPLHEFPGVFVSSRLPIEDPNLVLAEAYLAGGARVPVLVTLVPEPGSMALASVAAVALLGFGAMRRGRRSRAKAIAADPRSTKAFDALP